MSGGRAARAAYLALVFWIPVETVYYFKDDGASGGVTISQLLGLLLFGLALVEARRCFFRRIPAEFWLLACYLAAYAASQLWVPSALDARFREQQLTLLQMAALFLISANLFSDAGFRERVLRFYGWWIGVVAAVMLGGSFVAAEGRSSLPAQDPNVTAGFFALGAVCLAGDPRFFAPGRSRMRSIAALLPLAALVLGILGTGSRGGLIDFVVGILALAACGGRETRARRLLIGGAVMGALALALLHEFQRGTPTAVRLERAWEQGDTAGRTDIWKAAWSMVRERPLLGYGGADNLFELGVRMNFPFRDTHDLLLALLTEVGFLGAAPFVAALLCALGRAWRHAARSGDALPFALMAVLIAINVSLTGYHQKIFWIVFAAAAST